MAEETNTKRRNAVICVSVEALVCLVGFSVSLRAFLVVTNNAAGAFWAHTVLGVAVALLCVGLALKNEGRNWMTAGIVLNGLGAVLAFIAVIVDGVQSGYIQSTDFSRCIYSHEAGTTNCYGMGVLYTRDPYCPISYPANTCYCCYIYRNHNCDEFTFSLSNKPDQFQGVESCDQVNSEFKILMWTSLTFNVINFFVSILVCALVNMYKSRLNSVTPCHHPVPTQPMFRTQVMPSQGPVVIYTHHQSVGYYPNGPPTLLMPPAYSSIVDTDQPRPTQPGLFQVSGPPGYAGTNVASRGGASQAARRASQALPKPMTDTMPPPYSP